MIKYNSDKHLHTYKFINVHCVHCTLCTLKVAKSPQNKLSSLTSLSAAAAPPPTPVRDLVMKQGSIVKLI